MMLSRKQQGTKNEKLLDVYVTKIAGWIAPYLRLDRLKQQGAKVIVLTLMEALVTAAVVTAFMLVVFHLPWRFRCCWAPSAPLPRPLPA